MQEVATDADESPAQAQKQKQAMVITNFKRQTKIGSNA
jgi:hypothetical protein